jgi:hypothetical protein
MAESGAAEADKAPEPDTKGPQVAPPEEDKAGAAGAAPAAPAAGSGVGAMAVQAESTVGASDDPMEKEADAVAQRVMRATEAPEPPKAAETTAAETAKDDVVQRKEDSGSAESGGGPLPDSVQTYLDESKTGGTPLPEATRRDFESRMGGSFADVRVHDDGGADDAAKAIGAIAFTRNNHIYFASGMYDPGSDGGQSLLAHELTHVLQQSGRKPTTTPGASGGGAPASAVTPDSPAVIRRKKGDPPPAAAAAGPKGPKFDGTKGIVNLKPAKGEPHVELLSLPVPAFKAAIMGANQTVRKSGKRSTDQLNVWEGQVGPAVETRVSKKITDLVKQTKPKQNKGPIYYVETGSSKATRYLIGTPKDIAANVRRPRWDKKGKPNQFDVDHKLEYQLGGDDTTPAGNLWLLQFSANRSAGSVIAKSIETELSAVLAEAKPNLDGKVPGIDTIRKNWTIKVRAFQANGGPPSPANWEAADMSTDALTDPMRLVSDKEVGELKGTPDSFALYARPYGGAMREVDMAKPHLKRAGAFEATVASNGANQGGTLTGKIFPGNKRMEPGPFKADIKAMPGVDYGGYVDTSFARNKMLFKGFSPVELTDAEFYPDKGLVGGARITASTVPLLGSTEIGVRFAGEDVEAYALVTGSGVELPGPIKITGGALEVSAGMKGFGVSGDLFLEIDKLATGRLFGSGSSTGEFEVGAEFNFDTKMFTKAEIKGKYKSDGSWSVEGTLEIGEGKIAGIKSGSVKVAVDKDTVSGEGSFKSSMKGVEAGSLSFKYDKANGIEIAGKLGLGKLPGITGGTIEAKVAERKDGQGYTLSGGVTAQPAIPGVTGTIGGKYDDGAFEVLADLGYQRGMLNGKVKLGLTNQAIAEGKPAGPPTDDITVWGGGQVTIKITPWLQGTIGLELKPDGQMIVMGEVALPAALNLFEEKKVEKNIFTIGVDIPIVGVAVLGQRIGIFAFIKGGLDAHAGFGPGQLRELSLKVTYNPDKEADTRIQGKAALHVPASAGLRLFVQGGLGAGIPVVSATAGIEVSGALGLEGAARAAVDVDWTAGRGLVLDAKGEVFVEPKFKFAIEGFVDVSADLWIKTVNLYKKKWKFASFEYGSNLRFGVMFPVHYEEGKDFNLSLDQVQFTYPTIDTTELLKGLIARIA